MTESARTIEAIDRDLQVVVTRRTRSKSQMSQLRQGMASDGRHIDRLLEERHSALATAGAATPLVGCNPLVGQTP